MKEFEKLFKAHKQGKISTLEVFEKLFAKNDPIKSIQIEEIIVDDTTDEIQLPSRLQELRKMFYQPHHYKIEQDLYTATYNHSIDIKLELQSESRKKGNKVKYAKIKSKDKVSDYKTLTRKWTNRTLNTQEVKLRKRIISALGISDGIYNASVWVDLITKHRFSDEITEGEYYIELKEGLRELISSGQYDNPPSQKSHKKQSTINPFFANLFEE